LVNKETEKERLEEDHRVQIKVYMQKTKYLEYEQEKANDDLQRDGEDAKGKQNRYFEDRVTAMKKEKFFHKEELQENEKGNILDVQHTLEKDNKTLKKMKEEFD